MRPHPLRKTALLSLLGLFSPSSQTQTSTSTRNTPFSIHGPRTLPSPSPSTENLLTPSASSLASSPDLESSVLNADEDEDQDSSFTVSLPRATGAPITLGSLGVDDTPPSTQASSTSTSTSATTPSSHLPSSSSSSGAARSPTPYVRMRVAGVIAGAAGVLMV